MTTAGQVEEEWLEWYGERFAVRLGPGEEDVELEVWRCAQCLRIKPWGDGGGVCTDLPLGADEQKHLLECCDQCWNDIVKPLEAAFTRQNYWRAFGLHRT